MRAAGLHDWVAGEHADTIDPLAMGSDCFIYLTSGHSAAPINEILHTVYQFLVGLGYKLKKRDLLGDLKAIIDAGLEDGDAILEWFLDSFEFEQGDEPQF